MLLLNPASYMVSAKKFLIISLMLTAFTARAQFKFAKQAHRGGAGLVPENTTISAQTGVKYGCAIEMDIYMSKDSLFVINHGAHISSEYSSYPDGRPVLKEDEKNLMLNQMYYADIRKFDVGMRPNPAYPQQRKMPAHIPLLTESIDSAEAYAKRNNLAAPRYNLHLGPAFTITDAFREDFLKRLLKVIIDRGVQKRTMASSFDVGMLVTLHRLYPAMPIGYLLLVGKNDFDANMKKIPFKPDMYSPYYKDVTPQVITKCHQLGMKITTWTVDTKDDIKKLQLLGVDGIITDYPDLF